MNGDLDRKPSPLRSVGESRRRLSAFRVDLSRIKMNLKHKMKAEVSSVDGTDGLGAVKTVVNNSAIVN